MYIISDYWRNELEAKYVGKVLNNRYQLNERIGIGGMAEVYQELELLSEIKKRTEKNINVIISQNTKDKSYYIKELTNLIKIEK